jgi:hypothetical protein
MNAQDFDLIDKQDFKKENDMEMSLVRSNRRLLEISAYLVIVGSALSGPLGFLLVNLVNPITWTDVQSFASQYQVIQTLPYWFGFLYLAGFILFISASRPLLHEKDRIFGDAAMIATTIFASLIGLNYILQVGYVPSAVSDPNEVLAAFTMNNPKSVCWLLEMFGWGFLGAATWLISAAFAQTRLERIAQRLMILNGIGSILVAFLTPWVPDLLLQIPGLVAYFVWNFLIWVIMALIIVDLHSKPLSSV